jgi:hypothetical protein
MSKASLFPLVEKFRLGLKRMSVSRNCPGAVVERVTAIVPDPNG